MYREKLYLKLLEKRKASMEELHDETGLPSHVILSFLRELKGLIILEENSVEVAEPLQLALFLLKTGIPAKKVSQYVDWHDFERLASRILESHGYYVKTNFRLSQPRRLEIDVIGVDAYSKRAVMIDCKHWTRGLGRSALEEIAVKQYERVKQVMDNIPIAARKWKRITEVREAIPVIVTLTTPQIRAYSNTVIVSIQELNLLLRNIDYVIGTYNIVPVKRRNHKTL